MMRVAGGPRQWPRLARRALLRLVGPAALAPAGIARAADLGGPAIVPPRIWTSAFDTKSVWGYVDQHSVAAGNRFDLMLSTGPERSTVKGRIEFFRIGHHPDGQKLVWTSPELTVSQQPVSWCAAAVGAAWEPTLADIDTDSWPPGYYSADFVDAATGLRDMKVAQIVLRNPRRSGHILLKLSTNTYQAYNEWGGYSLYSTGDESKRGTTVSFDRPATPAFFEYEVYLARWLEALGADAGFGVDYATNFDVYHDPALVADYPLVISGSHDEYWSKEEFDAFQYRIYSLGRNVLFFGANAAYFQVRYAEIDRPPDGADRGRLLVCYKRLSDPIARRDSLADPLLLVTARFRDAARRPESMLMGVAYQNWFPILAGDSPRYPYVVERTDLPFFDGTGYRPGDIAADVVGYEWDNRDPGMDGNRLWDAKRSRIAPVPEESIKVLFRGTPIDADGRPGRAEAVYFESSAGAKVFSAGSVRWAWGLSKPGFEQEPFKRFNANLVKAFLNLS